jgi:hypothetical protein
MRLFAGTGGTGGITPAALAAHPGSAAPPVPHKLDTRTPLLGQAGAPRSLTNCHSGSGTAGSGRPRFRGSHRAGWRGRPETHPWRGSTFKEDRAQEAGYSDCPHSAGCSPHPRIIVTIGTAGLKDSGSTSYPGRSGFTDSSVPVGCMDCRGSTGSRDSSDNSDCNDSPFGNQGYRYCRIRRFPGSTDCKGPEGSSAYAESAHGAFCRDGTKDSGVPDCPGPSAYDIKTPHATGRGWWGCDGSARKSLNFGTILRIGTGGIIVTSQCSSLQLV